MIYFYGGIMNMAEQTERYAKWKLLVEEQEKSSQTQKQFCEERNLAVSKFCYYRSVIKPRISTEPNSTAVVTPITIKSIRNASESQIKITLPNGFRCELAAGADVSYVKRLVEVLLSC
jgi:hypothetical protein